MMSSSVSAPGRRCRNATGSRPHPARRPARRSWSRPLRSRTMSRLRGEIVRRHALERVGHARELRVEHLPAERVERARRSARARPGPGSRSRARPRILPADVGGQLSSCSWRRAAMSAASFWSCCSSMASRAMPAMCRSSAPTLRVDDVVELLADIGQDVVQLVARKQLVALLGEPLAGARSGRRSAARRRSPRMPRASSRARPPTDPTRRGCRR